MGCERGMGWLLVTGSFSFLPVFMFLIKLFMVYIILLILFQLIFRHVCFIVINAGFSAQIDYTRFRPLDHEMHILYTNEIYLGQGTCI